MYAKHPPPAELRSDDGYIYACIIFEEALQLTIIGSCNQHGVMG